MRYVSVSTIKGEAGDFNNNLRKEVFKKFGAKSSKLPAHFTIKAPFEHDEDISDLENILKEFSSNERKSPLEIRGFDHFGDRVVFMKVLMSKEGKEVHDKLIDTMGKLPYIDFDKKDGKDKVFHITVSSKRINHVFTDLWEYVNKLSCNFQSEFNNIGIYKWENNTWILHKEYLLK
jgi:2'-5' RNA ligase